MSASSSASHLRRRGFSLVELMVALVFTAILMAGMFKVFQASTSTFATLSETLAIQRNARWGLDLRALIAEDVLVTPHDVLRPAQLLAVRQRGRGCDAGRQPPRGEGHSRINRPGKCNRSRCVDGAGPRLGKREAAAAGELAFRLHLASAACGAVE